MTSFKIRFNKKKRRQIETNLFDEPNFGDELLLFRVLSSAINGNQLGSFKALNLEHTTIKSHKGMRNDIMHFKPIIEGQNDNINELLGFLKACKKIVSYI